MGNSKQQSNKNVGKKFLHSKANFESSKNGRQIQKGQHEKVKKGNPNKKLEIIEKRAAAKEEKHQKLVKYKKKRLEKVKVISKKTSRGQPLMKNRIEYLLKQIEEMKGK